jgi:NADH-quinone oxidoreductase subunit N
LFGALQMQNYWLPAIMIVGSIISFYYYFGIIRQMFMRSNEQRPVYNTVPLQIVIWICALLTLALGIYPNIVNDFVFKSFNIFTDLFFS